jgi:hypothetical protein
MKKQKLKERVIFGESSGCKFKVILLFSFNGFCTNRLLNSFRKVSLLAIDAHQNYSETY